MELSIEALRNRRNSKWTTYPPDVLPAFIAEMDFTLAPPVTEALHRVAAEGHTGYSGADHRRLSQAFAGFARRRLGWSPDPDRLMLAPEIHTSASEILRVLLAPGTGVVICPPVYPPYWDIVREGLCTPVEVPLKDGALDLGGIESRLAEGAGAVLLCSPHNPTGRVVPREELEAVAELAERHDAWVIADEVFAPLTLAGSTHVPYLTVSPAAARRGFALWSASKAFDLAGLKCALIATGHETTRAALERLPAGFHYRASLPGVLAAEAAFAEGDEWLDSLLGLLDRNRRALAGTLDRQLPGVRWASPQAGYLAWLDCRGLALGDDPAAAFLQRGRVALQAGLEFGSQGAGHARLNFATSTDLLDEIVQRMHRAVDGHAPA